MTTDKYMAKKKIQKTVAERISDVAQNWFLLGSLLFAAYCTRTTEENLKLHVSGRIQC